MRWCIAMVITNLLHQASTCQPTAISDSIAFAVEIESIRQRKTILDKVSILFGGVMCYFNYPSNQ